MVRIIYPWSNASGGEANIGFARVNSEASTYVVAEVENSNTEVRQLKRACRELSENHRTVRNTLKDLQESTDIHRKQWYQDRITAQLEMDEYERRIAHQEDDTTLANYYKFCMYFSDVEEAFNARIRDLEDAASRKSSEVRLLQLELNGNQAVIGDLNQENEKKRWSSGN